MRYDVTCVDCVVLVTDYGLDDAYAAALVGACLRVDPRLRVEHGTHGVPPGDVLGAALHLRALALAFPRGSVLCGVVDPGVGTGRGAVAVDCAGVRCVAPDTGLVHWLWEDAAASERRAVSVRIPGSAAPTFHGRDVFAPAAARLAAGGALEELGPPQDAPRTLEAARVRRRDGAWAARVAVADRFGNLLTTLRAGDLAADEVLAGAVWAGGETRRAVRTYADIGAGLAVLVGGGGHVELAADRACAAELSGLRPGDEVRILVRPAGDG